MEEELKYDKSSREYKIMYAFMKAHREDKLVLIQAEKKGKTKYFNDQMDLINKIYRLDKIDYKNIYKIVLFINQEEFWFKTIHSFSFLRKLNREKIKYVYFFVNKLNLDIKLKTKSLVLDKPEQEIKKENPLDKPDVEIKLINAQEKFAMLQKWGKKQDDLLDKQNSDE